ncbi:MAG: putative 3-ketoacyl-CoA reductase [Tardiphaga sp.]|jgi:NADP-dependent 3-hydroxy acid dehydrogenase YdfG|nr:putative 3-ketoacyl-CoA reductase [Tardiphaga sp.]
MEWELQLLAPSRRQQGHWSCDPELFASEGANVAICARNADEVSAVVAKLAATGVKACGQAFDVGDPVALKHWIDSAAAEHGGVDTPPWNSAND